MIIPSLKVFSFEEKAETETTSTPPVGAVRTIFNSVFDPAAANEIAVVKTYSTAGKSTSATVEYESSIAGFEESLLGELKTTGDIGAAKFVYGNDNIYFDPTGDWVAEDSRELTLFDLLYSATGTENDGQMDDIIANQYYLREDRPDADGLKSKLDNAGLSMFNGKSISSLGNLLVDEVNGLITVKLTSGRDNLTADMVYVNADSLDATDSNGKTLGSLTEIFGNGEWEYDSNSNSFKYYDKYEPDVE